MIVMCSKAIELVLHHNSKNKIPHFIKVHCIAHKTNMTKVIMLELNQVKRLKGLFQALYVFFTHSPKKFLEF
jgi:hypothetical protein